jgi:hypothetical protein
MTTFKERALSKFREKFEHLKPETVYAGVEITENDLQELEDFLSETIDLALKEGAEEYFRLIDKTGESYKISEAMGIILQKYINSIIKHEKEI